MKTNQISRNKHNLNLKKISACCIALFMLLTSFSALNQIAGPTTAQANGVDGDETPPIQNIEFGEPKLPITWHTNNYSIIGPYTPIWINSTDPESGTERIEYSVWLADDINANPLQWRHLPQYDTTVYDDDQDGTVTAEFYLLETCFHEIRYQCWNYEGLSEGLFTQDVFVDASAPETNKTVGCPQYDVGIIQPPWTSARTPIHFISTDLSCFPEGTGVTELVIKVWWKHDTCTDEGALIVIDTITIIDQDSNDLNSTIGIIEYEYHFPQTGFCELEFYGTDLLGNKEIEWKQQHRVDIEPPSIIKIHPTHGYMRINDHEGYLKCGLPISLSAEDQPTDTCNVGYDRLFWRYEYNGQTYPAPGDTDAISGTDLAVQYCFTDPEIENYWWYYTTETTTNITFNEECQHDLYYYATDNLGNYELHHQIYYVDNTEPYVELTYPDHGYYAGDVEYLKCNTPITLNAYDTPTHLCQSGIESIFWRYEWNSNDYPDEPGAGIISGQDLATMYGDDYNIPDITDYYWYYVNGATQDVAFSEQCRHDLYFFAKDNVCHRSEIYYLPFYVDNEAPYTTVSYPDHGYYENEYNYLKANTSITIDAYDLPDNECAAGIESIFWNYNWNDVYYPTGPGEGIVSGQDLVLWYGEDYNIPEITNYYWYYVDAATVDISFAEECNHILRFFTKDNVCHHSMIYELNLHVDNSTPMVDLTIPETHGYYYPGEGNAYIKPGVMFSIQATDLPDNYCAAGIEALFYRYEWNGTSYPFELGEGVIQGMDLVLLYGEDYNIPEITEYYWYLVEDNTVSMTFTEECNHELFYFAKDNVCQHSQVYHTTMHVDDSAPLIDLILPTHGYYKINDNEGYLSSTIPVLLQGTDLPDNPCASGIESIFYRYEWEGESYPNEPGAGIIHGEELFMLYGDDYNIPEITEYYWYYVDASSTEVYLQEQCTHQLFYFAKDNVCHRSEISSHLFRVDDQVPSITYELPQEHGYYIDDDRHEHIKLGNPVILTASDLPENECGSGIESIFYRYEWEGTSYPTGPGEGIINGQDLVVWYGEAYNTTEFTDYYWFRGDQTTAEIILSEECTHDVYYFTKDNVCHHSEIAHTTWYIDGTGPDVNVMYPDHGYTPISDTTGYLKVNTDITLTATDVPEGICAAGIEKLFYRYEWNSNSYPAGPGEGVISGQELVDLYGDDYNIPDIQPYYWYFVEDATTTISFAEQCQHDLYLFAKDNLCNHGDVVHYLYYVDATLPLITLEHPEDGFLYYEGQNYLRCGVPLWINATDNGECQAGIESIFYRYFWNDTFYPNEPGTGVVHGQDLVSMYGESYNIPDIADYYWYRVDADTVTVLFMEDCTHDLYYFAKDNVCQHTDVYTQTFNVDCEPPVIWKEIGEPHIVIIEEEEYCVTTQTMIQFGVYDEGCCGDLPFTASYKINDGLWILFTETREINFTEECNHTLTIRAEDCVGNVALDVETFHVDDTPPEIIKTVGDPKITIVENEEYCVTSATNITIETVNQGCCDCDADLIEYRIFFNEQWTDWMLYETPIHFQEECNHTLEIRATDCLGNSIVDSEIFHVDNTPPNLTKTVGYPNLYFGLDPYGHDQWYVYVETPISFVAEDESCCPCENPVIYYRIWYLGIWTDWMIYDEPIYFNRECIHYLEAYAADCLGNAGEIDNETFWVHAPPGYDDPTIAFVNPLNGSVHCERTLDVTINATDAQTLTSDLIVKIWMPGGRRNAPTFWYDAIYNPEDGSFHVSIDLFEYQNGAELTLEAYVIDGDSNYVFALPVTFTVCSNTAYDQWMQLGWSSLVIPPGAIGCENAVDKVLASIDGNYDWVFYYDLVTGQWHSYEYGEGGNDLQEMMAGELYWIHMTTADRYYTDSTPPTVTIEQPLNDIPLNSLHEITGTAYDGETGLERVMITLHDMDADNYWDGDSWELVQTEILCTGLDSWLYNTDIVSFISGHTYQVTAIAYDNAGCLGTDMVMFLWDANPPIINILDPIDGEQRTSGPSDINFEVYDQECYVTEVYVEIFDQTSNLYFNGSMWQVNQTWLPAIYDSGNLWYYPTDGIWPAEFGHVFQITVKAYDCIYNMGTHTHTFTIVEPQGECSPDRTYTTDADFDEGILTSVEHDTVHNQLQMIPGEVTTFPTMWVANAGEDSLSKWDTHENKELARYHTWFGPLGYHDAWSGPAPSRTCVDSEGNCYVANRHFDGLPADVIKIYTSNWIDRNGDGQLNTSGDINGNGYIEPDEMLPMTDSNFNNRIDDNEIVDERVAWAVTVGGNNGLGRSLAIDLEGNIWVGLYNSYTYYKISSVDGSILGGPYYVGSSPYGALVDRYGYLWGSTLGGTLLKLNTHNPTEYTNYYVSGTYGIALGYDSLGNTLVYCGGNSPYIVFNSSTGSYTYAPNGLFYTLGIATDSNGNIVAGSSSDGSVAKFAPNGDVLWNVPGQVYSEVRGIAVDSEDNVWAIHIYSSKLCKYNGTDGSYLGTFNSGLYPYTYSDATGLGYMTSISVGTWDVVHDSYAADTEWNRISWTSEEPEGSQITVKVRSSNDQMSWSPWEIATNGNTLSTTPPGRYLNILTTFEQDPLGESPILYDLTVDGTCAGVIETPHVSMQKQVWVPPITGEGGDMVPLDASTDGFVTYTYTLADIVIFGYEDNTTVTIYDYSGNTAWSGIVDDGTYHLEYASEGVYKLVGNKKYSVLTGDPISDGVMGYYGMDQNGYGASTKLYTYIPSSYSNDYFIVFAYTNGTEVTITNMDSATVAWSGTLNRGEHYTNGTLWSHFVKVESTYPVSALSYYDQGYFVPSANQKWSGTEFYTYADNLGNWPNTLHVMAYEDNTMVTIKDSESDFEYWTGTLNAGEEKELTSSSSIYYSIFTDKVVTVGVLPVDGYSNGYYYGGYMMDKTGSGIGTEFYVPTLPDGYGLIAMLWTFAFENDTTVSIYNATTAELMNTYHLNQGEAVNINQGYGYWHIVSDKRISGYSGWGDQAQAAFAPLLFGEAASPGYWAESRDASFGDIVRFKISIDNDGQCDYLSGSLTDYLPNGLQYIEGSTNITMIYNGETWYANDSNKEPWIIPGPDGTTLLWNGSSGIGQGYPPTMEAYFEFEALVVDCSNPVVVNTANVSVEPACGDTLYAEDTAVVNIICGEQPCNADRTYTTTADFNEGTFDGGVFADNDQLQLTPGEGITYPVMWIANNGEATVSKWDTDNNVELARYPTWFGTGVRWTSHDGPGPSRTCVDVYGNCYVANRHLYDPQPADVIKIFADDWIDRDGDGVLDTSTDLNHDGTITIDELLPMEDTNGNNRIDPNEIKDERVAWAVSIGPDNGVGRSLSIDPNGNLWLGLYNAQVYYKLSSVDGSILAGPISTPGHTPYGSLVDKYGILWGASLDYNLLKLDTNTNTFLGTYSLPDLSYGIALGYDSAQNTIVYLGGRWHSVFVKFNSSSEIATTPAALQYETYGIATDAQGNILAGNGNNGEMNKFAPNGSLIWHAAAQVPSHIRGTVVDSNNDVWALHLYDDKMAKFDGDNGAPLGVFNTGSYPYTYSDAAGLGYSSSVVTGKWTVVHDSLAPGTIWDMVSWNSDEPEGTSITVKVRSSVDQLTWSPWEDAENAMALLSTPAGQYIEIEVTMIITSGDISPILYDLTVEGTCSGQPQMGSISGMIYNQGSGYGPVVVYLSDTWPPETILDTVILDSSALPALYMFENLDAGVYYVGAFLDIGGNYVYDSYEPLGYAINHSWYADPLMVSGTDVTGADITLVDPAPSIEYWKYVWDGAAWVDGEPEPIVEVNVGETVRFNVTAHNDGNVVLIEATLVDTLPDELSYVENSTTVTVIFENGTRWYYNYTDPDSQPDVTNNPDGTTTLSWGYWETKPLPPCWGYIEYETAVTDCNETPIHNFAVGDAYYYTDNLHGEDDAWVHAICEEQPPEGSGATIDPDLLIVTLPPGGSTTEHKNVTTDEIPIGKLDVLFLFDLTGSMDSVIDTAKASSIDIMNNIRANITDSAFGVGSFMDYPEYYDFCDYADYYGDADSGDYPYLLNQNVTLDTNAINTTINDLFLGYGEDGPEAYARALYESQFAGWRLGARKIVIIFEDDVPHDCNLGSYGCDYYGDSSGVDPGRDAIAGTSDDLSWTNVTADLKAAQISVVAIDSSEGYGCPGVWEYATNETGGIYALLDDYETLPQQIVTLVQNVTATIHQLTFEPRAGYEDWFSWDPAYYTDVAGGITVAFNVTITVPLGTLPGVYHTWLMVMGDGAILAVQEQWITVVTGGVPDIEIMKQVWNQTLGDWDDETADLPMYAGLYFKLIVENTGDATLHDLNLTDYLPEEIEPYNWEGITFESSPNGPEWPMGNDWDETGQNYSWLIPELLSGEWFSIEFEASLTACGDWYTNLATVTAFYNEQPVSDDDTARVWGICNDCPYEPTNPDPANGATTVPLSQETISWVGGDPDAGDQVRYQIFFGTSTNPPYLGSTNYYPSEDPNPVTWDVGSLQPGTTYWWWISAEDQYHMCQIPGPLWNFTTQEEQTHTISGTIFYEGIPASQLIIAYYDEEPTGQDPTGSIVIPGPLEFPIPYTIPGLADDTYYVFAFIDHDDNMGPPEPDEPIGNAINNTIAEGYDPIVVNGADVTDVDITLTLPVLNNPPNMPNNPNPSNGGTVLVPPTTISVYWDGGDPDAMDHVWYDFYFGTTSPPPFRRTSGPWLGSDINQYYGNIEVTAEETYYWKIVARDDHGHTTEGPIWNFTTASTAGPALVNLGTAGDFVILSKAGISTTGTTSIVGDIGVSPIDSTAITGFGLILDSSGEFATSSLVTGKVYAADYAPPTPTKMTTAIHDMETAYTDAAGRTLPDFTDLGAGNIGGMTLVPGLYKWGTGVIIPTDVTLSGGANDVWIFQIAGTLDISSAKQVILSGGAQVKNIFWQATDVVTLGTDSIFKGNILSQTAIVLQNGAMLDGRTLAQTAVTLDANTVTLPV